MSGYRLLPPLLTSVSVLRRPLPAVLLFTTFVSLACAGIEEAVQPEPVPASRSDYIGTWTGGNITMVITPESEFQWKESEGNGVTRSVTAPIQSWHETGFDVGLGPFVTTYLVTESPNLKDGNWHMTVQGTALSRPPPQASP